SWRAEDPRDALRLRRDRSTKPLIERKRRERINNCLDQLKETVIGAFRLDQSKLEKADILEMTVKHLQNIQNNTLNEKCPNENNLSYSHTTNISPQHAPHLRLDGQNPRLPAPQPPSQVPSQIQSRAEPPHTEAGRVTLDQPRFPCLTPPQGRPGWEATSERRSTRSGC
uniref:BHLH domain-containing protein n=1 Tax=Xiphophorus couchianus TaxID=32473 RepID=A0A3B5L7L9_9TELE